MSTITTVTTPDAGAAVATETAPTRWVDVLRGELLKVSVTRRFLVLSLLLLGLAVLGLGWDQWQAPGPARWGDSAGTLTLVLFVLVPLVAAQIACADFPTGENATWFVLEPRRLRIVAAKLVTTVLVSAALVLAALALAAVIALAGGLLTGKGSDFTSDGLEPLEMASVLVISGALLGFAWGLLLQRYWMAVLLIVLQATVGNVVALLFLPERVAPYVTSASIPGMFDPSAPAGMAQGLVAATIWCLAPLVLGCWRIRRQHV